jgi:hypothetical protein
MRKMMLGRRTVLSLLLVASMWSVADHTFAFSREEVVSNARLYADHVWLCTRKNVRPEYNELVPGKSYKGVPYNWGGVDSLEDFGEKIEQGAIAGNYKKKCGRVLCARQDFAGLDCSGLVSRCWRIPRCSTKVLPFVSIRVPLVDLKSGDILNAENRHVVIFDRFDDENQMWVYESVVCLKMRETPPAGVAYRVVDLGNEYVPRRFYKFINIGDRVQTTRSVPLVKRPGGKARKYVSPKKTGTIMGGPKVQKTVGRTAQICNVWFYIKYDTGAEGWSPIRYLSLIQEKEQEALNSVRP